MSDGILAPGTRRGSRLGRLPSRGRAGGLAMATAACCLVAACTGTATGTTSQTTPSVGPGGTTSSPAPSSGSTAGTTDASGSSPLGSKWDWSNASKYTPYLHTIKGSVTFYELVWCKLENTQGTVDWAKTDRIVKQTSELGERLMLKIRVGRCWATGGAAQYQRGSGNKTESAMPKDLGLYSNFVKSAVQRYSAQGVHEYAVENEINSPSNWAGSPSDYAKLVGVASKAIRAADPKAVVVDPGLSSTTYGYGIADRLLSQGKDAQAIQAYNDYFQRRFGTRGERLPKVATVAALRAVLASDQGKRNLAYLDLVPKLAKSKMVDVRQIHFYEKWSNIPALLAYLDATTPSGTPIEAWEVGSFWKGSTATDSERSDEMVKSVGLLLAGGVRTVIWLPLTFDPSGRNGDEPRYGLLDPNGTVRPSGEAMARMVAASRGATVLPVTDKGLQGVAFEGKSGSDLFVWSASSPVRLALAAGDQAEAVVAGGTTGAAGASVEVDSHPTWVHLTSRVAPFLRGQS